MFVHIIVVFLKFVYEKKLTKVNTCVNIWKKYIYKCHNFSLNNKKSCECNFKLKNKNVFLYKYLITMVDRYFSCLLRARQDLVLKINIHNIYSF